MRGGIDLPLSIYTMAVKRTLRSSSTASTIVSRKSSVVRQTTKASGVTTKPAKSQKSGDTALASRVTPERDEEARPSKRLRLETPEPQEGKTTEGKPTTQGRVATIGRASLNRPAGPLRTNAPLITPRGSRVLAYTNENVDASPSKTGLPRPTTTTGHILEHACAHLINVDPRLKSLIEKHYCHTFSPAGLAEECDPFITLCSGIIGQQVSGAAASSIKRKFVGLFHDPPAEGQTAEDPTFPSPVQVACCSVPFLRQAGLSERKAEYIKGLAEKFNSGELSAAMLINASDEVVLEKLTAVRGLGKWSVEMFACFGLKRMDVLSTGDLGVQYDPLALDWSAFNS